MCEESESKNISSRSDALERDSVQTIRKELVIESDFSVMNNIENLNIIYPKARNMSGEDKLYPFSLKKEYKTNKSSKSEIDSQ